MPHHYAIVPAAGSGARFGSEVPKQYLDLNGHPLIHHALAALCHFSRIDGVWVVLSPDDEWWSAYDWTNLGPKLHVVFCGGSTRAESVANGLAAAAGALSENDWVLVHDAARPCLHQDDLARLLAISETSKVGGILAAPVRDTMKRAEPGKLAIAHTVERVDLWHALTPQFFPRELLHNCLTRALKEGATITDEASALEYCGFHPELVEGRADNIKVTRPEDLQLAEFYLTRSTHQEKA